MDLNEIEAVFQRELNMKVCPICGTPYRPRHSRQKTCGNPECSKAHHNEATKKRNAELKAEDPEAYRNRNRKASRKYRRKIQALNNREAQLKKLSEQWEKQLDFDRKVADYGLEYGKRSAEKTLAEVPKIDVNINREEKNYEQNICDKNEPHQDTE